MPAKRTFPSFQDPDDLRGPAIPKADVGAPDFGTGVRERRGRRATSDLDNRAFAHRFEAMLRAANISHTEVARRLRHSERQVAKWTTSQNPVIPEPAILIAIASEFKLSLDELLLGRSAKASAGSSGAVNLAQSFPSALRDALLAKSDLHDEESIEALLVEDGDLWMRLVDTYDLRLRLARIARILGLSAEQLSFTHRELEVRLKFEPKVAATAATTLAGREYLEKKRLKAKQTARKRRKSGP
jgi:hypothetical protein